MRYLLFACLFALVAACTGTGPAPATAGPPAGTADHTGPGFSANASTPGATCGGVAGMRCAEGLTCFFEDEVCGATLDSTGTCQAPPTMCTEQYMPVCGCDGKIYSNRCKAHAAGTSVSPSWVCEKAGK